MPQYYNMNMFTLGIIQTFVCIDSSAMPLPMPLALPMPVAMAIQLMPIPLATVSVHSVSSMGLSFYVRRKCNDGIVYSAHKQRFWERNSYTYIYYRLVECVQNISSYLHFGGKFPVRSRILLVQLINTEKNKGLLVVCRELLIELITL